MTGSKELQREPLIPLSDEKAAHYDLGSVHVTAQLLVRRL
jgi:hypothetical protein